MITTGMGVPMGGTMIEPRAGRIPFLAVDAYARRYGIEGGGFDLLLGLIEPMDREYLAWDAERASERARRMKG